MFSSQKIVNDFKDEYSGLSYREIAAMTGIQMTRVFRIFNQQEMRVSEYERFKQLLLQKKTGAARLLELLNQYAIFLSPSFTRRMERYLEREIKIADLTKKGGR
ncbi:MAG: hypothetical protein A2X86_18270 [Bdellovibrionales bacterium GWA2_49_15]|nr:MAG: hypothetical protein A2X86_18270 [Bdellovibrionales bacterium GWA2_49_15]HAZ11670.1 hypothetical protein [Bdellovibrionales bacterium]